MLVVVASLTAPPFSDAPGTPDVIAHQRSWFVNAGRPGFSTWINQTGGYPSRAAAMACIRRHTKAPAPPPSPVATTNSRAPERAPVQWDGDAWLVLAIGAAREDGTVFVHLASTTRFVGQKNGRRPIQICDWLPASALATQE